MVYHFIHGRLLIRLYFTAVYCSFVHYSSMRVCFNVILLILTVSRAHGSTPNSNTTIKMLKTIYPLMRLQRKRPDNARITFFRITSNHRTHDFVVYHIIPILRRFAFCTSCRPDQIQRMSNEANNVYPIRDASCP